MNNIINLLTKAFAGEFYRLNSGFFLLIGTLAFGFMSEVEHKALAQFFISSPYTILIPVGVWILYTLKILHFNTQQLYLDENRTIFNTAFLSPFEQILCCSTFLTLQLLPAHFYGIFLIAIAGKFDIYETIPIVILTLSGCSIAGIAIMVRNFRKPFREKTTSFIRKFFDHHFHKPLLQFYIESIVRRDALMIVGTKIFSGALVFGVCTLYTDENYDWRFLTMTLTACALANLLILFQLHDFEHNQISWIKNLPLTLAKRYGILCIAIGLLLIPECVVLVKYFPAELDNYWTILSTCYFLSLAWFLFGFLQIRSWSLERYTTTCFWIFVVFILLILFKTPIFLLSLANITAGFVMFRRNYYSFEPYRPATHQ